MNLIGGDWRFFYLENIRDFATFPQAWDTSLNTGIGQPALSSLWITSYFNLTAFFSSLGISWNVTTLLFYLLPIIFLGTLGSYLLSGLIVKNKNLQIIGSLVYLSNTYILMVIDGGQLGVALAYSISPLVIYLSIRARYNPSLKNSARFTLLLSLLFLFDIRIGLLLTPILGIILLSQKLTKRILILNIFFPSVGLFIIHSFWIVPLLISGSISAPEYLKDVSPEFLSFAKLENTISLHHPNWPENIFGKVYFMRVEFLLYPIIASVSLYLNHGKNKKITSYLVLLLLTGAFFAKGNNQPFGQINQYLNNNLPLFGTFYRDPTKFYIYIALAYSLITPITLNSLNKISINLKNLGIFMIIILVALTLRPQYSDKLDGIFSPKTIPSEYNQLKDFLRSSPPSRTLYFPKWQQLGYFDNNHPAIGREELFLSESDYTDKLSKFKKSQEVLKNRGVKYVVVPSDPYNEIYLEDRKYSSKVHNSILQDLDKTSFLTNKREFGEITLYEIEDSLPRFSIEKKQVKHKLVTPTRYTLKLENVKKGSLLIFTEQFNENWKLKVTNESITSNDSQGRNSFTLPKSGTYEAEVIFTKQKTLELFLLISFSTVLTLVFLSFKKK